MDALSQKLALRIDEVTELSGLGRTSVYAAIKGGQLTARKNGARTIILRADLQTFLERLPVVRGEKRNHFDFEDDDHA